MTLPKRHSTLRYITLTEASKLTPYDANYLGLLVRGKKLPAKKIKGRWMTTSKDVYAYLDSHGRVAFPHDPRLRRSALLVGVFVALLVGGIFALSAGTFWRNQTSQDGTVVSAVAVEAMATGSSKTVVGFGSAKDLSSSLATSERKETKIP